MGRTIKTDLRHLPVQGGVGQVLRRRGQPDRVHGGKAQAPLISNLRQDFLTGMGMPSRD
jgi:hypothetical protein